MLILHFLLPEPLEQHSSRASRFCQDIRNILSQSQKKTTPGVGHNTQLLQIRVRDIVGAPVRHRIELDAMRELHPCFGLFKSVVKLFVVPLLFLEMFSEIVEFREVLKLIRFARSGSVSLRKR